MVSSAALQGLCAKLTVQPVQDRRPLHHPLLRPRNRKHLPLRHHHPLERSLLVRLDIPPSPFPPKHPSTNLSPQQQHLLLHPNLHRNPPPPPRLPDLPTLRHFHPPLRDKLHARRHLPHHEHRPIPLADSLRDESDRGCGCVAYCCGFLCARGAEEAGVCGE